MAISYTAGLSDDQMANQFEVVFTTIPGGGDTNLLKLRMDRSMDIPERTMATYEIEYQGVKIPKLSAKEDTDKTFTLNFRLDGNWAVYNALNGWFKTGLNENNGSAGTEASNRTTVVFNAYGTGRAIKYSMTFNGVRIKSIKLETFDMTSAEPSRVECSFIYASVDT
jgi:hypothetical protein